MPVSHDYRPFSFFFDNFVDSAEGLVRGAVAIGLTMTIAWIASLGPAGQGLLSVTMMPFLAYAVVGYMSWRHPSPVTRWRSPHEKRQHLTEETLHFALRVVIAFAAGQYLATLLPTVESHARLILPVIIYVAQEKPYHDMHILLHLRSQQSSAADEAFLRRHTRGATQRRIPANFCTSHTKQHHLVRDPPRQTIESHEGSSGIVRVAHCHPTSWVQRYGCR